MLSLCFGPFGGSGDDCGTVYRFASDLARWGAAWPTPTASPAGRRACRALTEARCHVDLFRYGYVLVLARWGAAWLTPFARPAGRANS